MKLHLDKAAFQLVVDDISKKCSVRRDVLEKDYYVTLLLKELSEKELQDEKIIEVILRECFECKEDIEAMAEGDNLEMLVEKVMELVRNLYL